MATLPRIVEVYHVELGLDLVAVQMGEQVVVGYLGEVGVLEIIQEKRIALLDGLFYVLIDNCIGLEVIEQERIRRRFSQAVNTYDDHGQSKFRQSYNIW